MLEIKLLDGSSFKAFPSAAIILDFEPTFGIGMEKVGTDADLKSGTALKAIMEKFAWVLWRGHVSAAKLNGEEPRFKKFEDLIEAISPTELLEKGGKLLIAINTFPQAPDQPEKKN
jgi:hypothetical protein